MSRPSPRNGTARAAAARPRPAVTPVRPFALTVTAVQEVSPHLRRVTLGGTCLRDFATDDDGATWDLRVKLVVPPFGRPGIAAPALEAVPGGSAASWYETWLGLPEDERGDLRTYTVREARLDTVYPEIDL
ncbi:MAG: siderophore-interacting protein, partial [Sinomonas sp.]|nr:siderophore-interacting protein [Sinomonas sp.]